MSESFTVHWSRVWLAVALACCTGNLGASAALASGELKDPTRPPDSSEFESVETTASVSSPYALTAILLAEGRRIAVINGQPVQAGDRVSNAEVISILRYKVVLRAGNEAFTLRLLPHSIKINEATHP